MEESTPVPRRCVVCDQPVDAREAVRRKNADEFPHVYMPGARVIFGYGHVECFIGARAIPPPPVHAGAWSLWFLGKMINKPAEA